MATEGVIRVASFNVRSAHSFDGRHSWPFRRKAVAGVVAELDADLLAVQEAVTCQVRYLRRSHPERTFVGDGRSRRRRGEHCLVAAPAGITVLSHDTRWFGPEPSVPGQRLPGASFPRTATIAELRVHGSTVTFVCTHLDEKQPALRREEAAQLVAWSDLDRPTIVAGDLNAGPYSPDVHPLLDAGLRHALPSDVDTGGSTHRFTGRAGVRRIDHILVSEHFEVLDGRVVPICPGGKLPSDHWPVAATVRLRRPFG